MKYSNKKFKKIINLRSKAKNAKKYYVLKKNDCFNRKNLYNNFENAKNKQMIINNNNFMSEKNNKFINKDNNSTNRNNKKNNKNENKSPTADKHNNKLCLINSPKIKLSNLNNNKSDYSYENISKKQKKNKFQNINEESSNSKSQSKTRPNSNIKKAENSYQNMPKLNILIFIINNNWGNNNKIGINNLKILDRNNKNIPIKYSNFDLTKPYNTKYIKGELKKLIIGFDKSYNIKTIVIINGANDIGIKNVIIENDREKILWKGNIPKNRPYFISIDNYNINTNNKNPLFSKTLCLNKDESNNLMNIKYSSNSIRKRQYDNNYEGNKNNFELCDRIKIKLVKNYGNRDYIGLSGIELYDNNNKLINIPDNKKKIRINENVINLREKKILYNLFNNKNDTIDPQYMFLTENYKAFIDIEFKQEIKISKIIIYNYNNNKYKARSTKGMLIYFYHNKKSNKINKPIYLYLPPGEEHIDYGQVLLYPFDNHSYYDTKINKYLNYLHLTDYKMIYNEDYQYYSPYLPFGFILKIELYSNYGNRNYIGIESIQLFNEENNEINLELSLIKKDNSNEYDNEVNDNTNANDNISPRLYILPEGQRISPIKRPLILSKLNKFKDINNNFGEKRIVYIFNECTALSRIIINNYNKNIDISAKEIKILLDDNIIFEGVLRKLEINNIFFIDKKKLNDKHSTNPNNINDNKIPSKQKKYKSMYNKYKYKCKEERYIEYEGKNGAKILQLNSEL